MSQNILTIKIEVAYHEEDRISFLLSSPWLHQFTGTLGPLSVKSEKKWGLERFSVQSVTAAVWCVPFSGAVGFSIKLQKQKKKLGLGFWYFGILVF